MAHPEIAPARPPYPRFLQHQQSRWIQSLLAAVALMLMLALGAATVPGDR